MGEIPRLVIAAPKSGSGKTTVTVGLLANFCDIGLKVQSFKVGPDYIDPGYHKAATGRAAHNLDSYLMPDETMEALFMRQSRDMDLAVVEGVMGLYDGGAAGVSSTAQIAKLLGAPVVAVIDAKAMGATAAAVALGLKDFDRDLRFAGVILNRLASDNHEKLIREAFDKLAIPVFGAIRRDEELKLSERHLGLVPTAEKDFAELAKIKKVVGQGVNLDMLLSVAKSAEPLRRKLPTLPDNPTRVQIAVARDAAFNFYYPESLEVLKSCGAKLIFFSPLEDSELPPADGLILGGGFPEMFAEKLSANESMRRSIQRAVKDDMPVYAECGGYMYLSESLTDFAGRLFPMAGAIPGHALMKDKLKAVGYVAAQTLTDTILAPKGAVFKGHEFHFSDMEDMAEERAAFRMTKTRNNAEKIAGYACGNVLASYLHLHFAGCPAAAAYFVERCINYGERRNWAK